ncbi:MAG: hypothetical protein Q7R92_04340 [bacterium]|nr:hypothetical protein [bacterium]
MTIPEIGRGYIARAKFKANKYFQNVIIVNPPEPSLNKSCVLNLTDGDTRTICQVIFYAVEKTSVRDTFKVMGSDDFGRDFVGYLNSKQETGHLIFLNNDF